MKEFPFKKGIAKKPSEKRIKKFSSRKMKSFNVMFAYLTIPTTRATRVIFFKFIHTVITRFFLIQYFQKIHFTKRPLKNVDHELDEKVPFRPEKIKIYMQFINIWIRPLVMTMRRYGIHEGSKLCAEFMKYINLIYNEAYAMYSISLTTTHRPKQNLTKAVKNVYKADPHFLCIPSLHIAIVCLCFSFYKMIFEREGFTKEESENWFAELYHHAVEIGETVLYVKQHSVNCIPAALYMLTKVTPELFTQEMAHTFINDLFKTAEDVSPDDRKKITAHIESLYERFIKEGQNEHWSKPVARWLKEYVPYKSRTASLS